MSAADPERGKSGRLSPEKKKKKGEEEATVTGPDESMGRNNR